MAFLISPGVNVSEIDLSGYVPSVATTEGGIAGLFRWGPIDKLLLIESEKTLVSRYGAPTNHNPETFFVAADFLSYSNKLYVSRVGNTSGFSNTLEVQMTSANAVVIGFANTTEAGVAVGQKVLGIAIPEGTTVNSVVNSTAITLTNAPTATVNSSVAFLSPNAVFTSVANSGVVSNSFALNVIKNEDDYETKLAGIESDIHYVAKFPGELGNSLKISQCDSANQYNSTVSVDDANFTIGSNAAVLEFANNEVATDANAVFSIGDYIEVGNSTIGRQFLKITSKTVNTANLNLTFDEVYRLSENFSNVASINRYWEYFNVVDRVPGTSDYVRTSGNSAANDELHLVVVDSKGKFSGVPGTILEVYEGLSRATDAKTADGASNYYKDVLNNNSNFIWWTNDRSNAISANAQMVASSTETNPMSLNFIGGSDGDNENNVPVAIVSRGYDLFNAVEEIDVSLIMAGKSRGGVHGEQIGNYIIDNVAEIRKDVVAFISPERADVVNNPGKDQAQDVVQFRNALRSTSYAVLDSGYKYRYDKYNDVYRYTPLNGDIAGLCARTDLVRDPWWSPGGFNRGQLKNLVKLAWNPNQAERDLLYKNGVNPVVTFPGQGTVLYGDKTLLAKPSAFDRINVRRLFIVLEKAISTAAKYLLFEFNDEFTRAQFRSMIEPYLRDVQGRRGIIDFRVVCDETNNTGEVIDRNEFVGDIYLKPNKSINFIQLNFVSVRTSVSFEEIQGQF